MMVSKYRLITGVPMALIRIPEADLIVYDASRYQ